MSIFGRPRLVRGPMTPLALELGDKVRFAEEKQAYTVRAKSDRYVILTKPFNLRHTVLYTVMDWEFGVRGPDNYYGLGYETQEEIDEALALFERTDPDSMIRPEVSVRHDVYINIFSVNGVEI